MNYSYLHKQPNWRLEYLLRLVHPHSQTARRIKIVMATRHKYRPTRQVKKTAPADWIGGTK